MEAQIVEIISDQFEAILFEIINLNTNIAALIEVVNICKVLVMGILTYMILQGVVVRWFK